MQLTFLGANHEVTGSRTLLNINGQNILVDCGLEQGDDLYEQAEMPVSAGEISFVLVTHAHIDHTGKLPLLYKQGFRGTVLATRETCRLCGIMLKDSAHIQESDAEYKSRKAQRAGQPPVEPLYDLEDVAGLMKHFRPADYGERVEVCPGVTARFTDIGHLLGSAAIELWLSEDGVHKKLVFSGDVGNTDQPIINDPHPVESADYLVLESTYGDRLHEKRDGASSAEVLAGVLQRTFDRGGSVIIPAFAVGRTQELLYFLREIKERCLVRGHDGFPVYVDSPLANEATAIFLHCGAACLDPEAQAVVRAGGNPISFDGLRASVTAEDSKRLNEDRTPKVILSASGMCDAGRIRHHLKYNLWRPECTVLFAGYQSVGTLGRALYEGAKTVRLFGDEVAVNAEIASLQGVSGHADQQGLIRWVGHFADKPGQIFVNHGDDGACTALSQLLMGTYGCQADAPFSGSTYDLTAGHYTYQAPARPVSKAKGKLSAAKAGAAYAALTDAAARLSTAVRALKGHANAELAALTEKIEALLSELKK